MDVKGIMQSNVFGPPIHTASQPANRPANHDLFIFCKKARIHSCDLERQQLHLACSKLNTRLYCYLVIVITFSFRFLKFSQALANSFNHSQWLNSSSAVPIADVIPSIPSYAVFKIIVWPDLSTSVWPWLFRVKGPASSIFQWYILRPFVGFFKIIIWITQCQIKPPWVEFSQ